MKPTGGDATPQRKSSVNSKNFMDALKRLVIYSNNTLEGMRQVRFPPAANIQHVLRTFELLKVRMASSF